MKRHNPANSPEYIPLEWADYVDTQTEAKEHIISESGIDFSPEEIETINAIDQEEQFTDRNWSDEESDSIATYLSAGVEDIFNRSNSHLKH